MILAAIAGKSTSKIAPVAAFFTIPVVIFAAQTKYPICLKQVIRRNPIF